MKRRDFITLLGGVAAVWPRGALAQQPTLPVVGFLHISTPGAWVLPIDGFRQGLRESGYIEGQNVATKTLGLSCSMFDQMPAKTLSLTLRVDCNIVDEICVCFWPSNHIAMDPSSNLYDYDAARDDFRGKVSQHWCRLASYARNIFDESGTGDRADPCGVIRCGFTDKRCQY